MRRCLLCLVLAAGCNGDGSGQMMMMSQPIVRLVVDADRNGITDDKAPGDVMYRDAWDGMHGAIFLANVDDDDKKGKVDASDEIVNGETDAADLARIRVAPWPGAPMGTTGTLAADAASEVHLFKHAADGAWAIFHPGADTLSAGEIAAGVELGVEALDFAHPAAGMAPAWDGTLGLTLTVSDGAGKALGTDHARLRVAPLLLQSNIALPDTAYVAAFGDPDSNAFVDAVQVGADAARVPLTKIDGNDQRYVDAQGNTDQWTQDIFEVGFTAMPGPPDKGGQHALYVVIRTPVPDRVAADYTQDELLGPDFGWVWKHSEPYKRDVDSSSLDSFGNLDAIPPYANGASKYPMGRVLMGGVPARHVDDALRTFLDAQAVQGPHFAIDTSWLVVGHVDEVLSFVKAKSPRGWKLLVASPARARQVLGDLVAKDAANGDLIVFKGEKFLDANNNEVKGDVTIKALLADAERMAANQIVQGKIDGIRAALKKEIGLGDDEIVDVPVLFEGVPIGRGVTNYVAWSPGIVNLLHLDGVLLPPRAHGPIASGADALQADFEGRVGPLGDQVSWTEDWNLYHRLDGEVHCGTNVTRKVPQKPWWEVLP